MVEKNESSSIEVFNNLHRAKDVSPNNDVDILKIRTLLSEELSLAHAPITKKRVACVLETESKIHSGHNYEHINPLHFDHAEENTLKKILPDETIQKVFLAGKGHEKIKQVSPCSECYDALSQRFSSSTQLILFQPDTLDKTMSFTLEEHKEAYSSKPYSQIEGFNRRDIQKDLKKKTLLQDEGLEFVADLRLLGLNSGIHFFLTGSASGRGSMADLIHLKEGVSYRDIDLIAVTTLDRDVVEKMIEKISLSYFGTFDKRRTVVDNWFVNEVRKRSNYFSQEKEVIDLAVSPTLRGGMIRMDYLRKNFFHQIS